jgi:hypothetical protein
MTAMVFGGRVPYRPSGRKSEQIGFISGALDPMRSDRSAGMIFIIFLVSLGTIRVILASEERHKRKHNPAGITPDSAPVETTGDVLRLMRALEDPGRGKEPDIEPAREPDAAPAMLEPSA